MKATVFIPTYNAQPYIEDILQQLEKQKLNENFEVLIIDSGSTDNTLKIINKYLNKKTLNLRFHEISNSEFGHGKTRNLAAEMARGEFVVYLSHDAIPAHNKWLYELIKPFELNKKISGVMGAQIPRTFAPPIIKFQVQDAFSGFGPYFGTTIFYKDSFLKEAQHFYDSAAFYSDVNSAARKSILTSRLPYRDVPYAEDQIFGRDILEANLMKAYAPRGSVVHSNDISLRDYKHRIYDETMGYKANAIKYPDPSFMRISKIIIFASYREFRRIIKDPHYSRKKKIYWSFVNPFYHIERWRGVKLASRTSLEDYSKHSLEHKMKTK